MLSESYPPPLSLSISQARSASAIERDSMPALSRAVSRLAARRGGWAAFALALLITWATWSAACWLLARWQIH